jgi:hypothetical protein
MPQALGIVPAGHSFGLAPEGLALRLSQQFLRQLRSPGFLPKISSQFFRGTYQLRKDTAIRVEAATLARVFDRLWEGLQVQRMTVMFMLKPSRVNPSHGAHGAVAEAGKVTTLDAGIV